MIGLSISWNPETADSGWHERLAVHRSGAQGVISDGQVDSGVAESFAGADDSFLFTAGF